MVKKLPEHFNEKILQKVDQQEFRIEKIIKKKGDKLHVKWKRYDNSFNSCTEMSNYFRRLYKCFDGVSKLIYPIIQQKLI